MADERETVVLNVKLRQRSGSAAPRAFSCPGVLKATQTFPDEQDDELARLFVLTVDRARLSSVMTALGRHPDVELVEEAGRKRLITPKGSA